MNLRKWFGGGGGTSKKDKPTPKVVQIDMTGDHPDPILMKKLNYNPEYKVDKLGNKARELPSNFAKFIIEYEIKVDRPDATSEHVQKLIDLYTVSKHTYYRSDEMSITSRYLSLFLHTFQTF